MTQTRSREPNPGSSPSRRHVSRELSPASCRTDAWSGQRVVPQTPGETVRDNTTTPPGKSWWDGRPTLQPNRCSRRPTGAGHTASVIPPSRMRVPGSVYGWQHQMRCIDQCDHPVCRWLSRPALTTGLSGSPDERTSIPLGEPESQLAASLVGEHLADKEPRCIRCAFGHVWGEPIGSMRGPIGLREVAHGHKNSSTSSGNTRSHGELVPGGSR